MNRTKNIIFDLHGVLFTLAPQESVQRFLVLQEGFSLLQECKRADGNNYQIYACTNWSPAHVEQLHTEHPQVMTFFDGIVTASGAGARKPDPRIFAYLINTYDLQPEETVFIDDQLDNVLGARAAGMTALHAHDFTHLRNEFLRIGILE